MVGDDPTHEETFQHLKPKLFFGFSSLQSLSDYVAELNKRTPRPPEGLDEGSKWNGTRTVQEAFGLVRDGWPEGTREAAEIARSFEIEHATARAPHYSLAGASVSVGRMLSGNPAHMRSRPKREGRKVITLWSELAVSAGVSAAVMAKRAIVVAGICDTLESMGWACEIVATCGITSDDVDGKHFEYIMTTNLKQAGQVLNINDVIFGLGHPSMLRRFCFALCSSENSLHNIWRSQGYPARVFDKETEEFYLSAPSIAQAGEITKADNISKMVEIIAPKKLREILKITIDKGVAET